MAAGIRRICDHAGEIRLGPEFDRWGDDYNRALSFEVENNRLAVIGGLTWKLEDQEYEWMETEFIKARLRCAMDRVIRGLDGKPLRDADGNVVMRRRRLPMPHWPRGDREALG